jgi:putative acetyltransferase
MDNFDIRYSEETDLPYLKEWFETPESCSEFPFGEEVKNEALTNWLGFSRYRASLTATIEGVPCGIGTLFLMPYRKVAHHCSFYLMVAPAHRRKGIGAALVRNLVHLSKQRFRLEAIHVEIFEPNSLEKILERLGFTRYARQENYVHEHGKQRARLVYGRETQLFTPATGEQS